MLGDHHAIGPTGLDPPAGASNRRKANSLKRPFRGAITKGTMLKFLLENSSLLNILET